MKIRVEFTLEIDPKHVEDLKVLAGGAENFRAAAEFVRMDAAHYISDYMDSNQVPNKIVWDWER